METLLSPTTTYTIVRTLSTAIAKRDVLCTSETHSDKLVVHLTDLHEDTVIEPQKELCRFLSSLHNIHIPPLIEAFETDSRFCTVFPQIDGMSLGQTLRNHGNVTEEDAKILFTQMLDVVDYLHAAGFAHRNLSPSSILLNDMHKISVVGWSYATIRMGVPEKLSKDPMSAFDPPEALSGKPSVGAYYDCWSLGVLLYSMLCGNAPWTGDTPKDLFFAMTGGTVLRPREMSVQAHNLILSLLEFEPMRRFSPAQARSHAWLAGNRGGGMSKSGSGTKFIMVRPRRATATGPMVRPPSPGLTWV